MSEDYKKNSRKRIDGIRDAMNNEMGIGKLPPQAIEFEIAVLGAAMLEKSACETVCETMDVTHFYKEAHALIFSAIQAVRESSTNQVDILTVTHELRRLNVLEKVGGPIYISSLTNRVASTAHVETHCRVVMQKAISRELIRIANDAIKDAYDDSNDVFDQLDVTLTSLDKLQAGFTSNKVTHISESAREVIREMSIETGGDISGVPSGLRKLDNETNGWQNSDLIIVGARPGMGKTGFGISIAKNAAMTGFPVGIFTLEMSAKQIASRTIAQVDGNVKLHEMRGRNDVRKLTVDKIMSGSTMGQIEKMELYIDDTPALSVFDFRTKARTLVKKHGVCFIIIDYLQLMTVARGGKEAAGGNREQEISKISRTLKAIAKELDIPILAFSQVSRNCETRSDKRPTLSDLRESGAIEQDADIVGFLYRPEYYGENQTADGYPTAGLGQFILAKHRNGAINTDGVTCRFTGATTSWSDYNVDAYQAPTGIGANTSFENKAPLPPPPQENDGDLPF